MSIFACLSWRCAAMWAAAISISILTMIFSALAHARSPLEDVVLDAYYCAPPVGDPALNNCFRYLVAPAMRARGAALRGSSDGTELGLAVQPLVASLPEARASGVAIEKAALRTLRHPHLGVLSIPRAHHEKIVGFFEGGRIYKTTVTITVSFDAIHERPRQAECRLTASYSKMAVGQKSFLITKEPTEQQVEAWYSEVLTLTLKELFNRISLDRRASADAGGADYQASAFVLPAQLPGEVAQLLEGKQLAADAAKSLFQFEMMNLVSQFTADELRSRGIRNIELMPPPSIWARDEATRTVLSLVNRFAEDVQRANPGSVTNVTCSDIRWETDHRSSEAKISAGLLKADTVVQNRNEIKEIRQFVIQFGGRLRRMGPDGKSQILPAHLPQAEALATCIGSSVYEVVGGIRRDTATEVAMEASRICMKSLAKNLVDLMLQVKP